MLRAPIAGLRIRPGMSVDEVLDRADGSSYVRAYAGPANAPVAEFLVADTVYFTAETKTRHEFPTRSEMAAALTAEMKQHGVAWAMSFRYVSALPKRMYLTLEFSPDGRVKGTNSSPGSLN